MSEITIDAVQKPLYDISFSTNNIKSKMFSQAAEY